MTYLIFSVQILMNVRSCQICVEMDSVLTLWDPSDAFVKLATPLI